MTVVQSMHESPWLSALTGNRLQSANTAVCLLGGDPGAILHGTVHSGSHAEIRGTQALLAGFLFLCAILIPLLSPSTEKPGISLPSHS